MSQNTTWNHPIDKQYVISPFHPELTVYDIHFWLETIDASITERRVRDISVVFPDDALATSEHAAGTYTDIEWEDNIFPRIGLTFDSPTYSSDYVEEARYAILEAHEQYGVNALGMDYNHPQSILVVSTDPTTEKRG